VNIVCLPVEKTVHRAWLRKPVIRPNAKALHELILRPLRPDSSGDRHSGRVKKADGRKEIS
jgi:hypothetical protein